MKDDRRCWRNCRCGQLYAHGRSGKADGPSRRYARDCALYKAFQTENIREIVVVSRPDDMSRFMQICIEYGFDKVRAIVPEEIRQQSVFNGIGVVKGVRLFCHP